MTINLSYVFTMAGDGLLQLGQSTCSVLPVMMKMECNSFPDRRTLSSDIRLCRIPS